MPYKNLLLDSLAGRVNARYGDFNLRTNPQLPTRATRKIVGIGTANKGFKNSIFDVNSISSVKTEFGETNELSDIVSSIVDVNENEFNLSLLRVGSKPYHWRLMKKITGNEELEPLITIVPLNVEEDMMGKLSLILLPFKEGSSIRQRIIIKQKLADDTTPIVYDSERILVEAGELLFDIENNVPLGQIIYTPEALSTTNDINASRTDVKLEAISNLKAFENVTLTLNLAQASVLADDVLKSFSIYDESAAATQLAIADYQLDLVDGKPQSSLSHVERYAHLEQAYLELQDSDAEFMYCEGCLADVLPVSLTKDVKDDVFNWQNQSLGYQWKYEYNGIPYSFMFARSNPFDASHVPATYSHSFVSAPGTKAEMTQQGIKFVQKEIGDDNNAHTIQITVDNPAANTGNVALVRIHGSAAAVQITITPDDNVKTAVSQLELLNVLNGVAVDNVSVEQELAIADFNWIAETSGAAGDAVVILGQTAFSAGTAGTDNTTLQLIYTFTAEHQKLGDLLNLVNLTLHSDSTPVYKAEVFPTHKGLIECHITGDFTNVGVGVEIKTPFCEVTVKNNIANGESHAARLRPSLIDSSRSAVSTAMLSSNVGYDLDPFVNTHFDLIGESIPEAVIDRLVDYSSLPVGSETTLNAFNTAMITATLKASNDEVREISFMQQSAQLAYESSINYNSVIAIIPTTKSLASGKGLNEWAGNLPTYQIQDDGSVKVTEDGDGLLGNKLLVGSTTYRGAEAFGGIYLTKGDSLPNQKPYGISYADEALDEEGKKIDLGKHLIVSGSYGYMSDLNGKRRFVNAAPRLAQMFAQLTPGTEPLGAVNGVVPGINTGMMRVGNKLGNALADARIVMLNKNNQIISLSTLAHPSSDYTNLSTIMSSNEIVRRIRSEASSILGNAYTDAEISNLDTRMLGLSRAFVNAGYAQACNIQLVASRLDRINGVLNANVTFIPPFSIRAINVNITLDGNV